MKVGTDAVLLGAWADVTGSKRILDVGTGIGILALMLAQRTGGVASIVAADIYEAFCREASENFRDSPWPGSIEVQHVSMQELQTPVPFDLIISNPPYFTNSLKPPDTERVLARHADTLGHGEFLLHCERLLSQNGRVSVILPESDSERFIRSASQLRLFPARIVRVNTRPGKVSSRRLIELSRQNKPADRREMILLHEDGSWSDDYKQLTRDFYLEL
jgi:tRNA1Val (adenine37-N6)-methyltransferase